MLKWIGPKGVRNCKLFLPIITAKYVESANCYKETNLSVIVKKPIIPLLIGDVAWPPKGMGTLIGDLLYIRFENINASPEELWSGKPFNELVAQINKYLRPSAAISSSQPTTVAPVSQQFAHQNSDLTQQTIQTTSNEPGEAV